MASFFDRFWFPFGPQLGAMLGHVGPLEAPKRPSRRPKRLSRRSQVALQEVLKIAKIRQEASGGLWRVPEALKIDFWLFFDVFWVLFFIDFLVDVSWFV